MSVPQEVRSDAWPAVGRDAVAGRTVAPGEGLDPSLPGLRNVFFFGHIGAGKSFLGRHLELSRGWRFHEGDDDLTDAMRRAVAQRQPFTPEMRTEFVDRLSGRLEQLNRGPSPWCLAQGLFKNSERAILRRRFPELAFVWVRASELTLRRRLGARIDHVADLAYAEFANPFLETPDFPHVEVWNEGDAEHAVLQMAQALKRSYGERSL
jgi:gluconate kinase